MKFRAWGQNTETMLVPGKDDDFFEAVTVYDLQSCTGSMIWMQDTGLKDGKGKEIFEGDILTDHDEYFGTVEWHKDGSWGLMVFDDIYTYCQYFECLVSDVCGDCEIIGNIYENKDLLEVNPCQT